MMQVIICPPLEKSVYRALEHTHGRQFRWAYLGEDVVKALFLQKSIGNNGQRIDISEKIQETANILRQKYINYVGELSVKNNSLLWWSKSLSEKSPLNSRVFLQCCYLNVCSDILESNKNGGTIVFFVESRYLRKSILKNCCSTQKHAVLRVESLTQDIHELFGDISRFFRYKRVFFTDSLYKLILMRKYQFSNIRPKKNQKGKGFVLLHNWVDQRSFDSDDNYVDTYFGDLSDYLIQNGEDVLIVSQIIGNSYGELIKKIDQSKKNFLIPEAFINFSDILSVMFKTFMDYPKTQSYPLFENFDISDLIYENLKDDWTGSRVERSLLRYNIVKNINKRRLPVDRFIYTYENQVWEKAYCFAFREFYPATNVIGYQHVPVSNMFLNYFFSKNESAVMPSPDVIITSGKLTQKMFLESGYDAKKIRCGSAIRFAHILRMRDSTKVKGTSKDSHFPHKIIVTTSVDKNEALELIWKTLKAFEDEHDYEVVLKCHPLTPFDSMKNHLGINSLPPHFTISNGLLSNLLMKSDLLLYTSSTTCVEAMALTVPVVHVRSDYKLDLDPLDLNPETRISVSSPEEIKHAVRKIIDNEESIISSKRGGWGQTIGGLFGEINDEMYDVFIR
ncbi:MAG: hypothetical protein V1921_07895 [Candidatus Altiarchaeota archaeon]